MLNGKFQVDSKNSAQALTQLFAHFLVSGLAEQREHVLFIGLHARLVERIDTEQVTAYSASPLATPVVPEATFAFVSDAPGPIGSFSLFPFA